MDAQYGHEFEQAPGGGDGQGSLECCSPWGHRVGHDWATELNWQQVSNSWFHHLSSKLSAASLWSCPTLCDPIDGSPPGSPIPGILQARTLEWVAISFSNALKWKVKVKSLSRVRLLATPWTAAYQAPPPMGFSRQEYWSRVPLPSPLIALVRIKCSRNSELQNRIAILH